MSDSLLEDGINQEEKEEDVLTPLELISKLEEVSELTVCVCSAFRDNNLLYILQQSCLCLALRLG